MPFTALQSAFDALYPAGLQWYWRTDFFRQISDAAIDVHTRYGAQLLTGHSTMHLDPDPANAGLITRWDRTTSETCTPPRSAAAMSTS